MNVLKVLLLSQLIIGLAFSTKHVVDRVVARVGKTAILKSEVLAKMSAPGPFEATPKTYEDALSELEETILIKEITAKNNIAVSTEALEHAIDNIAKQNKMTKPQFLNALKAQGLTLEAYKDQLESHLNKMELIRAKISKTVHVSDSEIQAKYAKEYGQKSSLRGSNFGLEVNQISFPKSKKAAS